MFTKYNYFYYDNKIAFKLLIAFIILISSGFIQIAFCYREIPEFEVKIVDNLYSVLLLVSSFVFFLYLMASIGKQGLSKDSLNTEPNTF